MASTAASTLEEVRHEHAEALRQWREALELERRFLRERMWRDEATGVDHSVVGDEATRLIAQHDIAEKKQLAARRLHEAERHLLPARAAHANEQLAEAAPAYVEAAADLRRRLASLEAAWQRVVVEGWLLGEAVERERRAARTLLTAAVEAAPTEAARAALRQTVDYQVPVRLNERGEAVEWVERPTVAVFGGHGEVADPRTDTFWTNLGRLARAGRKRGPGACGDLVADRLRKTLAKVEGTR